MLGITALQHTKQMLVREAFWSFLLLDTLKTAYTMRNHSIDQQNRSIFSKIRGLFFSFLFLKRQVDPLSAICVALLHKKYIPFIDYCLYF